MRVSLLSRIGLCFVLVFCVNLAFAQQISPTDLAKRHIENNFKNWQLTQQDVADLAVVDNYFSKLSNVQRVIFQQQYSGIGIFQTNLNIGIPANGEPFNIGHRFIQNIAAKVNATSPTVSAEDALIAGLNYLEVDHQNEIKLKEKVSDQEFIFEQTSFTNSDIKVSLAYQPMNDNAELRLAWDMTIEQKGDDYWGLRIDALDGSFVHKNALTIHCDFNDHSNTGHQHDYTCQDKAHFDFVKQTQKAAAPNQTAITGTEYNVFTLPVESPVHGVRSQVVDPSEPMASPFGWHDTNGADGPEFTITRGNNVHAYIDAQSTDGPNTNAPEPDGGEDLHFDALFIDGSEPAAYEDAATINLFYVGNMMHDICYVNGFDEQAGNFQANNYGNGGNSGDYMRMEAQDGSGVNNANYSGGGDGGSGRVQMFVWDRNVGGEKYFQVTAPDNIAGNYPGIISSYGPSSIPEQISADVVEVNDGLYNPYISDGCEPNFLNGDELDGKIALVDRGGCYFVEKTLHAEAYGAVAIIICNFEEEAMGMTAPDGYGTPTIPTVSLGSSDCATIREYIGNGLELAVGPPPVEGPNYLDGDFDNGIICHEYGHGVSNRCVGGPSQTCLSGDEQMGEGWSDFFSIVTTVQPGDGPEIWRGVGTYVNRQPTTGKGIRSYPYSPDMSVNPLTYADTGTESIPHGVGAVWCTMLWDLYWAMVEEYGWSEDLYNGDLGNNMTIRLVIEGMKNLSCNPGFIDGRDAIMQADMDLYGGANQCLISKVFARRGLGINADQGSPNSATDGTENFEPIPTCIPELKISKTATPLISPGGEITYTIHVVNHRGMALTNVVVTDETPSGLTYVNNSASIAPAAVTSDMITFELGDMAFEDEVTITYKVVSDPGNKSTRLLYEDLDDGSDNDWYFQNITGFDVWDLNENDAYSGTYSWNVPNTAVENDQVLYYDDEITVNADNPVLRFYHRFVTEAGADGAIIEISNDGGTVWASPKDYMFRNGYTGPIQYATFVIPNLETFWGDSNGWIDSYVDLSAYAGQDIMFRFRFASDDNTAPANGGWFVDDIEYMDMVSYNGEACVTSNEGDEACASAADVGTIVNPVSLVNTQDVAAVSNVSIFPNPADQLLHINLTSKHNKDLAVAVLGTDGRQLLQQTFGGHKGNQTISLNVAELPAGFYFVSITSPEGNLVKKIVIE